ncbi:hypothetical protein ZIOFF_018858 [Zingiber officinale]|uniref:Mei2-like C-terminal RNA recognition motif domain-containing protein n=1 Tax=Zingiber officinale TaxID=94328 RepID=A0A8J5HQW0_ZINOF|nr:hypothetical protein ZIOFF_018858 [Zingiber officinale]
MGSFAICGFIASVFPLLVSITTNLFLHRCLILFFLFFLKKNLQSFNGKKWEKFNSEKVASLAYARIQGKAALIAHFQNSSLMNEDKRCRPILFHTDGPNAGDQEPFPVGNNIKSRSGRSRTACFEDHHLKESSSLASGEDSCDAMAFLPGS